MKPKKQPSLTQANFLYPDLLDQLDPKNPLLLLGKRIPWDIIENEFEKCYSPNGRPAKPVRLMVGLLLIKQIENLSDERVVELWVQNPYYQAFCGQKKFSWKFPCEPSDLTHFRKRIGEEGAERIFKISIDMHGKLALEADIVVDTTAQEKNITFPTDTKLQVKIMSKCRNIAAKEGITLRRSYTREEKSLKRIIRFNRSEKQKYVVRHARRRLKTIANALLRDVTSKLPDNKRKEYQKILNLYEKAINQKKNDSHKIYSLHEPEVACIAKGKDGKKYEFGSKAALAMTKNSAIIVGAKSFPDNRHDSKTLPDLIIQVGKLRNFAPEIAFCDRGFRGVEKVGRTNIQIPGVPNKATSEYKRRKSKKNFGRRSAIEPVIGHLKNDFRLARNFLKGTIGDAINLLLAATAFNMCKWMRRLAAALYFLFNFLCYIQKLPISQKMA